MHSNRPRWGDSFLAMHDTTVCQSIDCISTLNPARSIGPSRLARRRLCDAAGAQDRNAAGAVAHRTPRAFAAKRSMNRTEKWMKNCARDGHVDPRYDIPRWGKATRPGARFAVAYCNDGCIAAPGPIFWRLPLMTCSPSETPLSTATRFPSVGPSETRR